ncbi:hypothetical protein BJX63DRAFT_432778 [Aspergillus granulosus]|uniref:hydroxymethylglutaryl-CoA lyase n=1 Tax=Aspergillus granulosus TaxID=176169 RepID=A0ABR4H9R8_9EURO
MKPPHPGPSPSFNTPNSVRIVEVAPRDGLQNIPHRIPTSTKVELIARLARTGIHNIELTSIVSPRAVPQLGDCREVLGHEIVRELHHQQEQNRERLVGGEWESGTKTDAECDGDGAAVEVLRLSVLVPNIKGLEIALAHGVREVAVFVSATEGFSRANTKCSVEQGLERAVEVARRARRVGVAVRGYISSIFTDPITHTPTSPSAVLHCITTLLSSRIYEISLGDTTGTGTPTLVRSLLTYLTCHGVPLPKLAGHFHDSHGQGLQNVWEAYLCGIRVFDSSVSGLGGCPFAPGAKGNVATEEVVEMFEGEGVSTGIDGAVLGEVGRWVREVLGGIEGERGRGKDKDKDKAKEKGGRESGLGQASVHASGGQPRSSGGSVRSRIPTSWGGCGGVVRPVVYD